MLSAVAAAALALPGAPAEAAFGPNLIVNGSFEVPVTPTGVSTPPYGTCGAVVPIDANGLLLQTNEGCWTSPVGSIAVDRTIAKGGKQSVFVDSPPSNFGLLLQAVAAGAGTYRLQFLATPESSSVPFEVRLWSFSSGVLNQESRVSFGTVAYLVNGNPVRTWTTYRVDITAPAGTDHLVVCLFGVNGEQARFDAVTLRQQL